MSFNCQNCDSDHFDVYKGIYTCQYCGQAYRFMPAKGYVKCDPKEMLLLVSIVFKSGYRKSRRQTYDYIYDLEEEVNIGDKVVVLGYNGNETSVEVVKLKVLRIEELPMPINGYNYIIRKKEEAPPTPPQPPVNEPPTPICGTPFINKEYTDYEDTEIVPKEQAKFQRPKITPLTRYKETAEIVIFFGGLLLFWILTK